MKKFRALALFSGGLDSMLAVKLIKDQGIDVTAVFIDTGFGSLKERVAVIKKRAKMCEAEFKAVNIKESFIKDVLFSPKYGYGKNFNPCIDCHANMIRVARSLMSELDADFIITGEVLAQRPMSQRKDALENVRKLSGDSADNILLRPLSAKLLEPTKPEILGWVDREKLLGISGRSRETQLELAKKYGFEEYDTPAGGCLLTDRNFSQKIRDFIKYDDFKAEDIELLKLGRHLRLPSGVKLVVGRNRDENELLKHLKHSKSIIADVNSLPSPISRIDKKASNEDKELAAKIILTFTKAEKDKVYEVVFEDEKILQSPFESRDAFRDLFVR